MLADSYRTLFPNYSKLAGYDLLILQCEGSQFEDLKTPHRAILKKYADNGGRIFAEHLHSVWFRLGPAPWPATADWIGAGTDLDTPTALALAAALDPPVSEVAGDRARVPGAGQEPVVREERGLAGRQQRGRSGGNVRLWEHDLCPRGLLLRSGDYRRGFQP